METIGISTRSCKKRKVSKNKKKNWRKHSDIKDIEDFLEDQRLQLRTGGLVVDKPDESLFFEDKTKQPEGDKGDLRKRKRKLRPIYPHLEPDPNIKPLPKPTAYNPNKRSRHRKIRELNELEQLGIFTQGRLCKLEESINQSTRHQEKKKKEKAIKESRRAKYDLWGDADPISKAYGVKKGDDVSEYYLRYTKKIPRKLPTKYFAKPTKLPAVEVEAAGASYNPSYVDHQEFMNDLAKVEAAKERKEEKLDRWHTSVKKLNRTELENAYIDEMTVGLIEPSELQDAVDEEDTKDDITPNAPALADTRKTKKTRRKEREEKIKAQKFKADKINKIRMNEVYRLRGIKRELKEAEEESSIRTKARLDQKEAEEGMPKQVGKHQVEEVDFAIKLSDELTGTLRELKPEGDLLTERYKHFQKRNLIEARTTVRGSKRKMKEYTRKSHKDEEPQFSFRNRRGGSIKKILK